MQLFHQSQHQSAEHEQLREERCEEQVTPRGLTRGSRAGRTHGGPPRQTGGTFGSLSAPDTVYHLSGLSVRRGGQKVSSVREEGRWAAYILVLTQPLGKHEVPAALWPRGLCLKLEISAANWYAARFSDIPARSPLWSELQLPVVRSGGGLSRAAESARWISLANADE
jgi:hypothetical protein